MITPAGARRSLPPTSAFADDDGSAPAELARALAEPDPAQRLSAVVAALALVRVLVPVVAQLDERDEEGGQLVAGEKSASAAMVTVAASDGRAAVPIFSSIDTLAQWRPDARPIPVQAPRAALAAAADAEGLLVLDPSEPEPVLIPRPAVWALAQQRPWVPAAGDVKFAAAVRRLVMPLDQVAGVLVEPGGRAEVRVVLGLPPGLTRDAVGRVVRRVAQVLAGDEWVTERVDSLEFQVRQIER